MSEMLVGQPKSSIDQLAEYLDTHGESRVIDSRVVSKFSPEYWLLQLNGEGWRIVSRDTLPAQLPNGQTIFQPLVHFERQVTLNDMRGDLERLIAGARMQMAKAAGIVPATSIPTDLPDIAAIMASRGHK